MTFAVVALIFPAMAFAQGAPTIQSDKGDYAPGELVTLSGSGWQAGESVNIKVNDTYGASWSRNVDVTADASGNITDSFNLPDWFVSDYDVTATGAQSGTVTTTFTDGNVTVSGNVTDSVTNAVISGATVTCTSGCNNNPAVSATTNASGNYTFSGTNRLSFQGSGPATLTLKVSKPGYTDGTITVNVPSNNITVSNQNAALAPAVTATTVSNITASASSFGGTTNLSAKVSPAGAPGSVAFFVNGSSTAASGTVTYDSTTGVATLSNYSHGLAASATPYSVKAVFTPSGSSYSSSNATNASALTVNKANTTTTVSCDAGPFSYTGSAQTPCSASVSGPGLNNQAVTPVTYTNNTNAGTATASATYAGTANYNGSSGSEDFTIGKANTTTTVSCDAGPFTYDGTAQTPCSASVSGPGLNNQAVTPVTYTNNTNAGTATASATYAGTANYNGSTDSETFTIEKRDLIVSATGVNKVYDGSTSATVNLSTNKVTGDDVTANYTNASFANKNVGTGKAVSVSGITLSGTDKDNYTFNTTASTTADITVRTLTVTAAAQNKVYDGNTDATVSLLDNRVSGDVLSISYASASFADKNAGTGKVVTVSGISVTGTDSGNYTHNASTSTSANIAPRPITVTADAKTKILGATDPALTYQVTSGSLVTGESFSGQLIRDPGETVGTYAIKQGTLTAGSNYALTFVGANLKILFNYSGFLQPINDTAHQTGLLESKFKLGQTIPVKFQLRDAAGNLVQQATNPTFSKVYRGACDSSTAVETVPVITQDAGTQYIYTGGQYHYNWSTKGLQAGEWRIYANLADGTTNYVDICLTK